MILYCIKRERLKKFSSVNSLWFCGERRSVFIKFTENHITYFEITVDDNIFIGGLGHGRKTGKVRETEASYDMTPRSNLIIYKDISFELAELEKTIMSCEGLEESLRTCLLGYLREAQEPKLYYPQGFRSFHSRFLSVCA